MCFEFDLRNIYFLSICDCFSLVLFRAHSGKRNLRRMETNSSQLFRLQRKKKPDKFRSSPRNRLLSFIRPSRLLIWQARQFPPRVRNDKVGFPFLPSRVFPDLKEEELPKKQKYQIWGSTRECFSRLGKERGGDFLFGIYCIWGRARLYFIAPRVWGPAAKFRSNFSHVPPSLSFPWMVTNCSVHSFHERWEYIT